MKHLKSLSLLSLILILTLNSCKKEQEETTATSLPNISFTNGDSVEINFQDNDTSNDRVVFDANIEAEAKIKTFVIKEIKHLEDGTNVTSIYYDGTSDFQGEVLKVYNFDKTFVVNDFYENGIKANDIVYSFYVTDDELQEFTKTFTVTALFPVATPLAQPQSFEFKRIGGNSATGLDTYGLKWTNNAKIVHAQIKKDTATKLVILNSNDWTDITTVEDLTTAIENGNDVNVYDNVSAEASANYDDVLGVKVGGIYYILHVTHGNVTTSSAGTTITITGESRR